MCILLFLQIDQVLGDEPEVKEKLFAVLKQYAAERKVDWLASVLPDILTNEEHQKLIANIRYSKQQNLHISSLTPIGMLFPWHCDPLSVEIVSGSSS